jgi:hypothetical protein
MWRYCLISRYDKIKELEKAKQSSKRTIEKDRALLVALHINNLELGPKQILQMFGLKKAMEFMTPRELRVLFSHYNLRSFQRIMVDAKQIKLPRADSPLGVIREQIVKFKVCKV